MLIFNEELNYWETNDDWSEKIGVDINGDYVFQLTDRAPQKARESFEMYQREPIHTCQDVAYSVEWQNAGLDVKDGFMRWKKAGYPKLSRYLEKIQSSSQSSNDNFDNMNMVSHTYGSEYNTLLSHENIKFIVDNFGRNRSPQITHTVGRIYVIVSKEGNIKNIELFDNNGLISRQIALDHFHDGMMPHTHVGDNFSITRKVTQEEKELIDMVKMLWGKAIPDMFNTYNENTITIEYANIEEFIDDFSTDLIRGIVYSNKLYALTVEGGYFELVDPLIKDEYEYGYGYGYGYKHIESVDCKVSDIEDLPLCAWHTFDNRSLGDVFSQLQFPLL